MKVGDLVMQQHDNHWVYKVIWSNGDRVDVFLLGEDEMEYVDVDISRLRRCIMSFGGAVYDGN